LADAHGNIPSPAFSIVFIKSKTETSLKHYFVIAHIVADNNVKPESVAATRDSRLHPLNSPDLNPVDYRV